MEIKVDVSPWPIVRVTYPSEITAQDIDAFGDRLEKIYRARGSMVLVIFLDALSPGSVTPMVRKRIAEMADRLGAQRALVAEAVVVDHPLIRGLYQLYTWIGRKHSYPAQSFAEGQAAMTWARAQVASFRVASL